MAGEIIGHGDGRPGVMLSCGTEVSMQVLQQVYKDITDRSETLSKDYDINHKATFADLEQLNYRIDQILEQYNVMEKNCFLTFFHIDESRENFSSFDRARAYEAASTSPIENIRIEYTFLIVLPIAKKPQQYKITVDVHSRAGLLEKLKKEGGVSATFVEVLLQKTGYLSIEYIDYAVARNMMHSIDQWFHSIPNTPKSSFLRIAKKSAKEANFVFHVGTLLLVSLVFYRLFSNHILPIKSGQFLAFGVLAFATITASAHIAGKAGTLIHRSLSGRFEESYVKVNRGDDVVIEKMAKSNFISYVKAALAFIIAIAANLFSAWLGNFIGLGV